MRIFVGLFGLVLLAATGWVAVSAGVERAYMSSAPRIESGINTRTAAAVSGIATHPITVETNGRWVTVRGLADSEEQRDALIAAANDVAGTEFLTDEIEVLPTADPYMFSAEQLGTDRLRLSGDVPGVAVRDQILDFAKTRFGGSVVEDDLRIAAGVPDGDWSGMVTTGLDALGSMGDGRLRLSGTEARLAGSVGGEAGEAAVREIVARAPMGDWTTDLTLILPVAEPYRFSAEKAEDGGIVLGGNAPDRATRTALTDTAGGIGPVEGTLELADGMPEGWPDLVGRGLEALGTLESGALEIEDDRVRLTGQVDTDQEFAALLGMTERAWLDNIGIRNPTPPAVLKVRLADGTLSAEGSLPNGVTADDLTSRVPGIAADGLEARPRPSAADWSRAFDGLSVVLPRMVEAEAGITEGTITLSGLLERGFSASGAEAALRTGAGPGWEIETDLTERAPLAELVFAMREGDISVSGVLPAGIEPDKALEMIGDRAGGEGLTGGGDGDAAAWGSALETLPAVLSHFSDAAGRMADGALELSGKLGPGYPGDVLAGHYGPLLPEGWSLDMDAEDTAPSEGDRRASLGSRETETFSRGYWLPVFEFRAAPAACRERIEAALANDEITFVTGSAEIDAQARAILNRIAGISVRCLNSSEIRLEIGGHTDAVGADAANLELSRARAEAVRDALIERGVKGDAMTATGYGETRPVDSNDTPEGRARNRRISFDWQG